LVKIRNRRNHKRKWWEGCKKTVAPFPPKLIRFCKKFRWTSLGVIYPSRVAEANVDMRLFRMYSTIFNVTLMWFD